MTGLSLVAISMAISPVGPKWGTLQARELQWGPRGLLRTIRIATFEVRAALGAPRRQGILSEGTTASQTGGGALNIPTLGLSLVRSAPGLRPHTQLRTPRHTTPPSTVERRRCGTLRRHSLQKTRAFFSEIHDEMCVVLYTDLHDTRTRTPHPTYAPTRSCDREKHTRSDP